MRRVRIILLSIFIILVTSFLSQVKAVELEVDADIDIMVDIPLKASIKRSTYNVLSSNETVLEENYNLKEHLSKINVKNQRKSSACWAFSFSTILETSVAKQHNKVSKEYSPMHIEYATSQMFNRTVGSGAGPRLSVAYCVSGHGPVEESQMPFASVYDDSTGYKDIKSVGNLDKTIAARIRETMEFPNIYKKISNNTIQYFSDSACKKLYTSNDLEIAKKLIKEHIKTYGALSADVYMNEAKYYNPTTVSYNYNDYNNRQQPNHVVSIVGWDDNYSVDNFKEGAKPLNKGAYIALNSYGTDWGNGGYLYISYEDACIEESLIGITDIQEYENNKKDYDKIYQYDELGMNIGLPLGGESVYAANQYTRQIVADKEEYIQEVGLYIAKASGVEVYINPDGDDIQKAKLVAKPLEALETGYHTVKLAEPIKLTGNKFAIKVKYTNQEGAYVPMEVNYKTFGLEGTSYFFDNATANDGEGFISKDNSNWNDVNKTIINSGGKQYNLTNASNCIKAFTTYQTKTLETVATTDSSKKSVQSIKLNKTTLEVQEGAKFNLSVTFQPTDATNKNIKWHTSDEKIATISETGMITAVSTGKVTITATTEDGNKTASCTITVTPKISTEDDIYVDNTDNNNDEIYIYDTKNLDTTTATKIIPYAGNSIVIIIGFILFVLIAIIICIRLRCLKDVK